MKTVNALITMSCVGFLGFVAGMIVVYNQNKNMEQKMIQELKDVVTNAEIKVLRDENEKLKSEKREA